MTIQTQTGLATSGNLADLDKEAKLDIPWSIPDVTNGLTAGANTVSKSFDVRGRNRHRIQTSALTGTTAGTMVIQGNLTTDEVNGVWTQIASVTTNVITEDKNFWALIRINYTVAPGTGTPRVDILSVREPGDVT